jgi:putative ATP-dependent endonuclease of OLD family
MYLRSLTLSSFRSCYNTTVAFQPTLTLLVGENNSGKSNVIEALRLATVPLNLRRTRYFEADDRSRGRDGEAVELDLELDGLTEIQQSLYLPALDITTGRVLYKTRFRPDADVRGALRCPSMRAGTAGLTPSLKSASRSGTFTSRPCGTPSGSSTQPAAAGWRSSSSS